MKQGVPMHIAFDLRSPDITLDDDERLAIAVVMGEFEGGTFSWQSGRWQERK